MARMVQNNKHAGKGTFLAALFLLTISAHPAKADWRSDMGVFRIGIATKGGEPYKPGTFEAFRKAVSNALQMPVEIFQARDAAALIDAQAASRIEYSVLTTLGHVTADAICSCVEPLVAPVNGEGAVAVRSVLIAATDRFASLSQIETSKVAVGKPESLTMGLIPQLEFRVGGQRLNETGATIVHMADQEAALQALAVGEVDAVFAWEPVDEAGDAVGRSAISLWLDAHPDVKTGTVWRSRPIPFGPHTIRKNLPTEAVDALRTLLASLNDKDPLAYDAISGDFAGGFRPVSRVDYDSARQLLAAMKASSGTK